MQKIIFNRCKKSTFFHYLCNPIAKWYYQLKLSENHEQTKTLLYQAQAKQVD